MAKFIVLRNGVNLKVFEFDGNIARIGSGGTVDLQLETPGIEGDLFFIAKQPSGYEIESRVRDMSFTINGAVAGDRVILKEGDKVGFLDYMMVVTYQIQPSVAAVEPVQVVAEPPKPTVQVTATAIPVVEPTPQPPAPVPAPEPPKPAARRGERATVIINSQEMAAQAQQERMAPPPVEHRDAGPVRPNPPSPPPKQEPPRQPKKQKISSVYTLCVLSGQHKGRAFEIDTQEYLIGRERGLCDLVLDHDEQGQPESAISREHCVITSTDEGLYLTDKRSQLRTFVNRKIIEPGQREFIAPEDIISIPAPSGEVFMRLCFRGQENFAPMGTSSPINPKWIMILAAVIVALIVVLILLMR